MEKYDLIIVGAGPAGIFTAVELLRHGSKKKMLLVEKGKPVEKRHCPKAEVGHCVNCRPTCAITTGFSGAGAFSDGKLSLSYEVGGDLPTLIGEEFAQELIDYTDKIYLEFGADPHVEGIYTGEDIKEIRKNAIHAGLKLVDCPIRHLGTEKAQELYLAIQNYLADNGVEMRFNTECENIILEEEGCKGVLLKDGDSLLPVYADEVVIGTGRRGADWLEKLCAEHHIAHKPGTVDIGVRVECRNEVMEKVNKVLYESKLIGYPKPWKNKVRTFCQNPGGFVAQENYDNDLAVVNGHSFKEKKSENTNLAILVSHNFTEPFNQPIAYAQKVGELTNMLGAGHIMVQRYGDILDGKRTWQKELAQSNVKPTLKDAVAGDITAAMPYRAMTNIIEFIKMLDMVVPGFAANETLLYSPELKFYSNKVKMDENLDTNIQGLHCLGDSSGWTRGLMMASVEGFSHGLDPRVLSLGVAALIVVGFFFIRSQLREPYPLLPFDLLRIPIFSVSVLTSICSFLGQMLAMVALPFYLQQACGYNDVETGLLLTAWPAVIMVVAPAAGLLVERIHAGLLGGTGLTMMAAGLFLLAFLPEHPTDFDIIWRLVLCGAGFGLFQSPNNSILIASAPPERSGSASGMLATARLAGQTTGAALMALLFHVVPENSTHTALLLAGGFAVAGAAVSLARIRLPLPEGLKRIKNEKLRIKN